MTTTTSPYPGLISLTDPRAGATEEYRILRTNLQFMGIENKISKIVVTSTQPGEGKTTVSSNLGVVIAQAGKKVLIVDCDLRRPAIHPVFHEKLSPGLTNFFTQETNDITSIVKKTKVPGLDIVTSGPLPPNPSELLASIRMKIFIDEASKQYDFVIIDSPPSGAFADASMLSKITDGVLYVCSSGHVKRDYIKRATDNFKKINAKILGIVVNKVSKKTLSYNYGYYAYYHSYYENQNLDDETSKVHKK